MITSLNIFPVEMLSTRLGEIEVIRMPGDADLMVRARNGQFYLFSGFEYSRIFLDIVDLCVAIDLYVDGAIVFA